jgi:hypothetical protein
MIDSNLSILQAIPAFRNYFRAGENDVFGSKCVLADATSPMIVVP